jgi:signal peptidase I
VLAAPVGLVLGACGSSHGNSLARGDIVAFRPPPDARAQCGATGVLHQRIVALPGERWEERGGYVYINGKRLSEPYVAAAQRNTDTLGPISVPDETYFVMGDNRVSACDSTVWGPLRQTLIIRRRKHQ